MFLSFSWLKCDGAGPSTIKLFLSENKLASLEVTLVRNYDSLTHRPTNRVKCRATSVAEKRITLLCSATAGTFFIDRLGFKYLPQVREMSRTVNAAQMKLVEGEEGDKLELASLMEVNFLDLA